MCLDVSFLSGTHSVPYEKGSIRMRLKWLFWAIFAGCIAAAVALFWPVRPLWMWLDSVPASVKQYSPDGQSLYTVHHPGKGESPYLCRLDAATGTVVQKTVLEGLVSTAIGKNGYSIRLSQDARTLFVGTPSPGAMAIDTWHLYDAQTGKRRSEAILNVGHFNPESDALSGRWFWTYHGDRNAGKAFDGLDVYSMETGQCILPLRPQQGVRPWNIQLHPTQDQALVFWSNGHDQSYLQLIRLPSGEEIKRFNLPILQPGQRWEGIHRWEADMIWVEYTWTDAGSLMQRRARQFDLRQDILGSGTEEPLLAGSSHADGGQTWWENGDDWVAYFRDYIPGQGLSGIPWLTTARDWIEKKLNLPKPRFSSMAWVRIVKRPLGEEQYTLPFPVGTHAVISRDGRRLACGTTEGGVAVFDLDPLPRWPFVILAGGTTGGLILLLGRWRKAGHTVRAAQ